VLFYSKYIEIKLPTPRRVPKRFTFCQLQLYQSCFAVCKQAHGQMCTGRLWVCFCVNVCLQYRCCLRISKFPHKLLDLVSSLPEMCTILYSLCSMVTCQCSYRLVLQLPIRISPNLPERTLLYIHELFASSRRSDGKTEKNR